MSQTETKVDYPQLAKEARKKVLSMIHLAGTSHIASNFSCIDFATVLYENLKEGDEVVWSAGWKAATIYYFLAQQGKIPKEDLDRFAKEENGKIEYLGLAETNVPGVWVSGGSVGQGLSVATGMAYAKKLSEEKGRIFCILSDGELDEGSVWEAARIAARHKLDNLVAIIDQNGWQALGRTEEVNGGDPKKIFEGFGWNVINIDGHDFSEIEGALGWADITQTKRNLAPAVIVAKTLKGKGVKMFEDKILYHYAHVDESTYLIAMKELDEK